MAHVFVHNAIQFYFNISLDIECQNIISVESVCLTNVTSSAAIVQKYLQLHQLP